MGYVGQSCLQSEKVRQAWVLELGCYVMASGKWVGTEGFTLINELIFWWIYNIIASLEGSEKQEAGPSWRKLVPEGMSSEGCI